MKEKKVMKLASRGKRFGAYCIDQIVPVVACLILFITSITMTIATAYSYNYYQYGYGYNPGYGMGISGGAVAAIVISFLLLIAYIVVQLIMYNKSQTLGKAVLGLQVVSSSNGEPIGFWKMLFREWIVKQASGSAFLLGYIWVLIDDKNRGWHDKILDTYVVDLKESAAIQERQSRHDSALDTEIKIDDISQDDIIE